MILFNKMNSGTLAGTKFVYISFSIQSAFLPVRHFKANILLGIFSYFALVNIVFVYCIIFDAAYKIPENMSALHGKLMLASKQLYSPLVVEVKSVGKDIAALQTVRFKVAGFSAVERNSSLIFIGFVLTQAVALLVSFP